MRGWDAESPLSIARLGIIEKEEDREAGRPLAVLCVIDDEGSPEIVDTLLPAEGGPSRETMPEVLKALDLPPSGRMGADRTLAGRCDCWFTDDGWELREPTHLVSVSFVRTCFSVDSVIHEANDIVLLMDPDEPLDGRGDAEAGYRAQHRYINEAFERLFETNPGTRPGFSSWMTDGEPRHVKVVGDALSNEIAELHGRIGVRP